MKAFIKFMKRPKVRLICTWLGFTWGRFCVFGITLWWLDDYNLIQLLGMCMLVLLELYVGDAAQKSMGLEEKPEWIFIATSYAAAIVSSGYFFQSVGIHGTI